MFLINFLKEVGKRTYNFFVGPKLIGGIIPPGDWWHFELGINLFWDSAPGFHFDQVGFELYFGPWVLFLYYTDNG